MLTYFMCVRVHLGVGERNGVCEYPFSGEVLEHS